MINLTKKYVIGTHIMFYEIEIFKEFIDGLINMIEIIENKENVFFDFHLNTTEYLEKIDTSKISKDEITQIFLDGMNKLSKSGAENIYWDLGNGSMYFHTDYRRDLNYKYCKKVDYVVWGETDSLIPREGLQAIDTLAHYTDPQNIHKYIMCFADRKMWDNSWDPTVHVDYESHTFVDDENGHLHPKQAKSQMSIEQMNNINSTVEDFDFRMIPYTKIDGSFLVISSDLIKSGVNIPLCMLYNDDEGLAISYNQVHPNKIRQFICKNLLKVHARRHPNKRMYVKGEENEYSFNDQKGNAFQVFKDLSQKNIQTLHTGDNKFYEYNDLKKLI